MIAFSATDLAWLEDTRDAEGNAPVSEWRIPCSGCGRDVVVECADPGAEEEWCDSCCYEFENAEAAE